MGQINRQKDSAAIRRYLELRTQQFTASGETVSAVEVGYEVTQSGWLYIHGDKRKEHERDGEWTMALDEDDEVLELDHWVEADPEEVGQFVREVVLTARDEGVFASLKTLGPVQIDIEDFDGAWAWPAYDDLGKTNLV